jgi:hypothetical protein
MQAISFRALPLPVRVMTALSMLMAWVMVAEFVIDRYEIDRFLPFYRYGDICIYDFVAAALVLAFWVLANRTRP